MVTTVNSIANATTTKAPATGNAAAASKTLADNYNTFLTLLTTQLQHQDPLNPTDSTQFTNQLVQFSSVEQQIKQNSNLESLISLFKGQQSTNAVSYIGKSVTATGGQAVLANGQATWKYKIAGDGKAVFTIKDAQGNTVATSQQQVSAGDQSFHWNGAGNNISKLPDGIYTLSIAALDSSGAALNSTVYTSGVVTSVDTVDGGQLLSLGGAHVALSDIISVAQVP